MRPPCARTPRTEGSHALSDPRFHRIIIVATFGAVNHRRVSLPKTSYKPCPARTMRRLEPRRRAIVAVCCSNGVATQQIQTMDIAAIRRSDHCRVVFRKPFRIPRDFSETAWDKKIIRGLDPLWAGKARQNAVLRGSKRPRKDRMGVNTVPKEGY